MIGVNCTKCALGHSATLDLGDQATLEECREGVRVETPTGADRQTAFPGRPCDPHSPDLPPAAGDQGGENGDAAAPWRRRREVEEMELFLEDLRGE